MGKVSVFINGVKQQHTVDIGNVVGSINNDENMVIGTLYGWKTDGTLDEYRLYDRALSPTEVADIYAINPPTAAGCPPPPAPPPPPPPPPPPVDTVVAGGLVMYLRMDEEAGNQVADITEFSNSATSPGVVANARFCRGRAFIESGPQGINVPSDPTLEFGTGSFSVMGWAKFDDYTYPRTSFVAKNGHGCYFGEGRGGAISALGVSAAFSRKTLAFISQASRKCCRYLQTHP